MQTVDGLALPKKSAKEEAAAMTTVDITCVPSTAFTRSVSTNLHDPGGGSFLFGKHQSYSQISYWIVTAYICEEEGLKWMVPVFRFFEYVNFERKEQKVNSRS